MKRIILLIMGSILYLNMFAQAAKAQTDVIIKTNGEELSGKIVKMTDAEIVFKYTGENLEYNIKKADISKITHASGRVETFQQAQNTNQAGVSASQTKDVRNKVAILPFSFIKDSEGGADEVGLKAQNDAYGYLTKHSAGYTILDPRTSNALLIKAGVTKDKMMGYTMKELCDIMGVEYVIDGTITQTKAAAMTNAVETNNANIKRNDNDKIKGATGSTFATSNTTQRYDVTVSLSIYMNNDSSIFNEKRKALFGNTDGSYNSSLEYLLKRCPLYRK